MVEHLQLFNTTRAGCSMSHVCTAEQNSTESRWEPHLCCETFRLVGSDLSEVGQCRQEDSGSVHSPLLVVWLFSHWVGNRKWWTAPSSFVCFRHTTSSQTFVSTRSRILLLMEAFIRVLFFTLKHKPPGCYVTLTSSDWVKLSNWRMVRICLLLLCPQRAVCHRQALQREEQRLRIRSQVHQEAAEPGQQARSAKGGGGKGGGHPAADPAPQHRDAARRVREPHWHHPHPGTVSHAIRNWRKQQQNSVENLFAPSSHSQARCDNLSVDTRRLMELLYQMHGEAQETKKKFLTRSHVPMKCQQECF